MVMIGKIASAIIALAFLVIITYGLLGNSFPSLKQVVEGVKDMAPNVTIGAGSLKAGKPTISESGGGEAVNKLTITLKEMADTGYSNCFRNSGDLPVFEKGTKISIIDNGDGSSTVEINTGGGADSNSGKQNVEKIKIEGMTPCVIAGKEGDIEIAENFYKRYFAGESISGPYFMPVSRIDIFYSMGEGFSNLGGLLCNDGNVIRVSDFQGAWVTACNNFESEGWLFKPDENHICFFPTNYNANGDKDGIANEWFSSEDDSISKQINGGTLHLC